MSGTTGLARGGIAAAGIGGGEGGGGGIPAADLKQKGESVLGLRIGLVHEDAGPDWILARAERNPELLPSTIVGQTASGNYITLSLPNELVAAGQATGWGFIATRGAALATTIDVGAKRIRWTVPAAGVTFTALRNSLATTTYPIRAGLPGAGTARHFGTSTIVITGNGGATWAAPPINGSKQNSFSAGRPDEPIGASIDVTNKRVQARYRAASDTLDAIRGALHELEKDGARLLVTPIAGTNLAAVAEATTVADTPFTEFYGGGQEPDDFTPYVLPQATETTLGGVTGITQDIVDAAGIDSGALNYQRVFGWSGRLFIRLTDLVLSNRLAVWAFGSNTAVIPAAKLGADVGGTPGSKVLYDDGTFKAAPTGGGGGGTDGSFERTIFRAAASAPATPTAPDAVAAGGNPTLPTGWAATPPAGDTPIWASFQRVARGATTVTYTTPRRWDGAESDGGTPGLGAAYTQPLIFTDYRYNGGGAGSFSRDNSDNVSLVLKTEDAVYGPYLAQFQGSRITVTLDGSSFTATVGAVTTSGGTYRFPLHNRNGNFSAPGNSAGLRVEFAPAVGSASIGYIEIADAAGLTAFLNAQVASPKPALVLFTAAVDVTYRGRQINVSERQLRYFDAGDAFGRNFYTTPSIDFVRAGDTINLLPASSPGNLASQIAAYRLNDDAAVVQITADFRTGVRSYVTGQRYYLAPHHSSEVLMVLLSEYGSSGGPVAAISVTPDRIDALADLDGDYTLDVRPTDYFPDGVTQLQVWFGDEAVHEVAWTEDNGPFRVAFNVSTAEETQIAASGNSVLVRAVFYNTSGGGETWVAEVGTLLEVGPTSSAAGSEPDVNIGGAMTLGAASAWTTYPITEDIERDRYYKFLFREGSTNRFMASNEFRGSDFLNLGVTSGSSFSQSSSAEVLGITCPRPDADGVRTFFLARTSNARQILTRVANNYNIVRLTKVGGVPGPQGIPGPADLTQRQQIELMGLNIAPHAVRLADVAGDYQLRYEAPPFNMWAAMSVQGQASARQALHGATHRTYTISTSLAETLDQNNANAKAYDLEFLIYDAASGGNLITTIRQSLSIVRALGAEEMLDAVKKPRTAADRGKPLVVAAGDEDAMAVGTFPSGFNPVLVHSGNVTIASSGTSVDAGFDWPADAQYLAVEVNPGNPSEAGEDIHIIRNPRLGRGLLDTTPVTAVSGAGAVITGDAASVSFTLARRNVSSGESGLAVYFGRTTTNRAVIQVSSGSGDPMPLTVARL